LAALDFAVDLDAFDAAFFERLEVAEDFFRVEVVRVLSFLVAMRRTVPQLRVASPDESLPEKLRSLDDRGVAVTLNRLEVRPILGHDLGLPPPRADRDEDVER